VAAYSVCLSSDWYPDRSFLALLELALGRWGCSAYLVWPYNLKETLEKLLAGTLELRYLVDRASNTSPEFLPLTDLLTARGVPCLDSPEGMFRAADKAIMHSEFHRAGIPVPATVILASAAQEELVAVLPEALDRLGRPFVIKPASMTGGGIGVFERGLNIDDIQRVRQMYPHDRYLLQERVRPLERDGRRFWFRVFHVCGQTVATWWDDRTHRYDVLEPSQERSYGLAPLTVVGQRIARVCGLHLFSSEVVLDPAGRFVVVDYVNETPDLRVRSETEDGVPDGIVQLVAAELARHICGQLAESR
jgi:hypothetical protein